jgi:NAD(P)-dependent dehydrogenase (short-subunit alcohol dehydrogenase family)
MEKKSILITGCSSGIGLAAANALKQKGYRVFAGVRKPADLTLLKAQGLESVQLDVTYPASMDYALQEILSLTGGTLDALFNNAGYLQAGAIEDLKIEQLRAQFETNVFGQIELIQRVLPIMRAQGHGRIIQNSSILGVVTLPYYGAYNASKFAIEGVINTLRQELRGTSITVSIINPGPIRSKLRDHAFQLYQDHLQPNATSSVHHAVYKKLEEHYFHPNAQETKLTLEPEAVVKKLMLALESKHPRAHYFVGLPAQSLAFLHRILPEKTVDWLVSKMQ